MDFKKENSYISHYDISSLDIRFGCVRLSNTFKNFNITTYISHYLSFSRLYSFFLLFSHFLKKWYTIPFLTLFLPLKWWLIPNLHQKTYQKWGLHTKYRIQSHIKYIRNTKTHIVHYTQTK